jgi:hypothetical protein
LHEHPPRPHRPRLGAHARGGPRSHRGDEPRSPPLLVRGGSLPAPGAPSRSRVHLMTSRIQSEQSGTGLARLSGPGKHERPDGSSPRPRQRSVLRPENSRRGAAGQGRPSTGAFQPAPRPDLAGDRRRGCPGRPTRIGPSSARRPTGLSWPSRARCAGRSATLAIVAINGWNRLSVRFRGPAGDYVSHRRPGSAQRVERRRQRIGRVGRRRAPVPPRCVSPTRRAPQRGAAAHRPRTGPPGTAAGRASGTRRSAGRGRSRSRLEPGGDGRGRDRPTRRSARGR